MYKNYLLSGQYLYQSRPQMTVGDRNSRSNITPPKNYLSAKPPFYPQPRQNLISHPT
ncbi:MAG: hypothetical protein HC941_16720 [Microcoleus sp. SU_5_3]|nr:hypothetical protein [Microcoleus sp. SU_5_3]